MTAATDPPTVVDAWASWPAERPMPDARGPLTEQHVAALRKTLEHVLAHPGEHRQDHWGVREPCGTRYCLAGHAAVTVAGATPRWDVDGVLEAVVPAGERDPVTVRSYAGEVLGLTATETLELFFGQRTRLELAELVRRYTDGRVDLVDEFRAEVPA